MSNVIELTSEQKDAFFQVVNELPKNIYSLNGAQSPIEKLNGGVNREGLVAELLKDVANGNVFLRIVKKIKASKDLEKTVQEIIEFYNNPKNEEIWKLEH